MKPTIITREPLVRTPLTWAQLDEAFDALGKDFDERMERLSAASRAHAILVKAGIPCFLSLGSVVVSPANRESAARAIEEANL